MLSEILKYLTIKELCCVSGVCKKLNAASELDVLWKDLFPHKKSGKQKKQHLSAKKRITQNIFDKASETYILEGHSDMITHLTLNDSELISSSRDSTACVWDLQKMRARTLSGHSNWVLSGHRFPCGIVTTSSDKTIRIWGEKEECKVIRAHKKPINCSKKINDRHLVTGGYDNSVKVWDTKSGKCKFVFEGLISHVNSLAFDNNLVAANPGLTNEVCVWDYHSGQEVYHVNPNQAIPNRFGFANGFKSIYMKHPLLFAGENNKVKVWDLRVDTQVGTAPIPTRLLKSMNITADRNPRGVFKTILCEDNNTLAVGAAGLCGLLAFDMRKMKQALYLSVHDYPILDLDTGRDVLSHLAATTGTTTYYQYEIAVFDLNNPQEKNIKLIPGHKAVVTSLEIGDDFIVTGAKDGGLRAMAFKMNRQRLKRTQTAKKIRC